MTLPHGFAKSGQAYEPLTHAQADAFVRDADEALDAKVRHEALVRLGRAGIFAPPEWRPSALAPLLKDAKYATCIAGKWQLGRDPELPKKFGFDEHCLWQHTRRPPRYANPGLEINGVKKDYTKGEYGPDIVSDYALDFIQRKRDAPFFLYYPMMLTHAPYDATPDSAVNAGPYTDGVCRHVCPTSASSGSCGYCTATCVYGLAWYTARMRP